MKYKIIKKNKIYRLLNTNPLLLISTVSKDKKHNIAPIAWVCPQELKPARLLFCIDTGHKTFENIRKTKKFVASIPHISQVNLVKKAGSISGKLIDKFFYLKIKSQINKKTGCKIPEGVIGYMECVIKKIFILDGTAIVISDITNAYADKKAFDGERLLAEKQKGKAIHHLGKNNFITYSNKIFLSFLFNNFLFL